MNRRRFLQLASGAAAAGTLPIRLGRAAEGAGSLGAYPISERDAVFYNFKYRPQGGKPPAGIWNGVPLESPFPNLAGDGPYQPTWESLAHYGEAPEWYRDAKFGIWAHWSPQCVPENGDGYARLLYNEGSADYFDHCARYGHPTKFGYKDLCAQWKLQSWDPDALMARYQAAGAKFFFGLANHHDGFDAWNSKHHVWNSVNLGPKRDVLGGWAAAARKRGMRFGVTVHAARNWWWFQVARLCDRKGPLTGIPYDGTLTAADGKDQWWRDFDPEVLYGRKHAVTDLPDTPYVKNFYDRIRDLIDQHDPDLLYFDDTLLPLGWGGMNLGAYFYNHNLQTRGGKMEAVLNVKQVHDDLHARAAVADVERGVVDSILPHPHEKTHVQPHRCKESCNTCTLMRFTLTAPRLLAMFYRTLFLALLLLTQVARATPEDGRDEIFPPKAAAQDAIHWKDGYFVIHGKPTFISSGSIHYARVPRELWRDRIWRLKMMGFNAVQSYIFWNASEPKEGQWDFSDNNDLDAWLLLLQDMNMYGLERVGPYSCGEWELGGYPSWLTVKPGMIDRELGPSVAYSDPHLDKVEKIVARHQVNHGGSVFMVQLENEHPHGWGTQVIDSYLRYLDDQADRNGIEVPTFNSGMRHRGDPTASDEAPFPVGPSPWYTTEFWTGYIGKPTATWSNGDLAKGALDGKTHGTWKIIAFGGAGYNYYMGHGGTSFGYSGDGEPPGVSYDYSAPVGEAGQLHNLYFPARRAAYFAQSFTPLLTGSHDDPKLAACDQPALRVTARTNPTQGSFIMIDHFQRKAGPAPAADPNLPLETHVTASGLTLPHKGGFHVGTAEPRTILLNVPWTPNAFFESVCTNVLARQTVGQTDYWICYGPAGESGEVTLKRKTPAAGPSQFDFTYPAGDAVSEINLDSGDGRHAVLLVMNTERTNRTWLAHDRLYVGPSFVLENGSLEFPPEGGIATIYAAAGKSEVTQPAATVPDLPALANWSWRDAAPERGADFDATKWLPSTGPQPMETYDSFQNRYGWYRATLPVDKAGPVTLHFGGQSGTFVPYLNGQPGTMTTLTHGQSGSLTFPDARPGDNTLAILVKASPRSKTLFYDLDGMRTARGLWGGVSTNAASTPVDVSWKRWDKATRVADAAALAKPDYDDSTWTTVAPPALALTTPRGDSWYRGTFNVTPALVDSMLESPHFAPPPPVQGQREPQPPKVIVYLNGQLLSDYTVDVSKLLIPGKNTVLVLIQSRLGGDVGQLSLALWHNAPLAHATWHFHGGLDDLDETAIIGRVTNWDDFLAHRPWQTGASTRANQPTFWKCRFDWHKTPNTPQTVGLDTAGLKAGHVWLNGHNLGESPQGCPMYLPECWIKDGANDLVVLDIYGNKPDQLKLTRYEAFSVTNAL